MSFSPIATPALANQVQLHELLFNRSKQKEPVVKKRAKRPKVTVFGKKRKKRKRPPAIQTTRKKAPAKKKRSAIRQVAGPTYYDYRAAPLTTVTVASLVPDLQSTGAIAEVETPQGAEAITLPPMTVLQSNRFAEAAQYAPDTAIAVEKEIAKAIRAHYAEKADYLWVNGMSVTPQARAVAELLSRAGEHGLQPGNYAVEPPRDGWSMDDPASRHGDLIAFEMEMTARAMRYAMDMKDGVVDPNKLSGYHDFSKERLTAEAALAMLSSAKDPEAALAALAPQQPDYQLLKTELAAFAGRKDDAIVLPEKLFLRPGQTNEALPLLVKAIEKKLRTETRLAHTEALNAYAGSLDYTDDLVALVRDVQRDLGLVPDGIVGPKTVSRLGGESLQSKINRVKLAMERLRWHPENYGSRHVVINQPEYRVRYMENGETKLAMNSIVGKPSNQTYFFHDEIETVVFNPYWGVPQSIIVNEMLPRLHRDPGYLDRAGYVVTTHSGKQIASSSINWWKYAGPVPYNVRQKPGPKNALGELKILFPNDHAIYMHDTPARNLFAREARAFSHGCVRLEDPRAMAAAVLGKDRTYVASQLGGYEKGEALSDKVPIYIAYFTAWPGDDGAVAYHADIYGRDKHLTKAMDAVAKVREASDS